MTAFIECTSLNITFNVMGIATVTYTIVSDSNDLNQVEDTIPLTAGGKTFDGFVTNISMNQIQNTVWYEMHVTIIATTNAGGG